MYPLQFFFYLIYKSSIDIRYFTDGLVNAVTISSKPGKNGKFKTKTFFTSWLHTIFKNITQLYSISLNLIPWKLVIWYSVLYFRVKMKTILENWTQSLNRVFFHFLFTFLFRTKFRKTFVFVVLSKAKKVSTCPPLITGDLVPIEWIKNDLLPLCQTTYYLIVLLISSVIPITNGCL